MNAHIHQQPDEEDNDPVIELPKRKIDWKSIGAVIGTLITLLGLLIGFASTTAVRNATVDQTAKTVAEHEHEIDELKAQKADKDQLQHVEDKVDKANDKLDELKNIMIRQRSH